MALHLRPWNTNFIKLCSFRYCATSTSVDGCKSDVKVTDNVAENGDDASHEVMHAAACTQAVHGVHEVLVSHHSSMKGRPNGLPLLPHVPVGSRLHALVLETKKLTKALLPEDSSQKNNFKFVPEHFPKVDPSTSTDSAVLGRYWSSKYEEKVLAQEIDTRGVLPSENATSRTCEKNVSKLDSLSCLDQLFMGNILQPLSYTADDIVLHNTETGSVGFEFWLGSDDKQSDVLREYRLTDAVDTDPDIECSRGIVIDNPRDLIIRECSPITVVPYKTVPNDNSSILDFRSENEAPVLDENCDISSEISPVSSEKSKAMRYPADVDEYHCSTKSMGDVEKSNDVDLNTLLKVKERLEHEFLRFFVKVHSYDMYHKDVRFENNYWGEEQVFRGLNAYAWELNKIKMGAHFKFSNVRFHILKITHHEEDNTIKIRWRINGLPALTSFLKFWKFFPGQYKNAVDKESEWHDGFSTFHVGKDGLIYKHRVDRLMVDEDRVDTKKTGLAATLAVLIGLIPRPSLGDLNSFMLTRKKPVLPPNL